MSEPVHEPADPSSVDSPATATADENLLAVLADEFAARLRRGELSEQDKDLLGVLAGASDLATMQEIKGQMHDRGHRSRTFYDLCNAFDDAGFAERTKIDGRWGWQITQKGKVFAS